MTPKMKADVMTTSYGDVFVGGIGVSVSIDRLFDIDLCFVSRLL